MFAWIKAILLQLMKEKAVFGNASIKIRIVFESRSTPFFT